MIRKFVMCAFMALMATSLSAQENPNVVYKVAVGEVNHKSKAAASTGETIANVASALLAGSIKVNMATTQMTFVPKWYQLSAMYADLMR